MTEQQRQPRPDSADALTRDFLTWLADASRTYAEAMAAWRTSCPKFAIWEDALADDLIQIESVPGGPFDQARVTLTPRGEALLVEPSRSSAQPHAHSDSI